MPRAGTSKEQRDKHYREYQSRPDVMKRRAEANKARRMKEDELGKAALRGKDVHHVKPLRSGGKSTAGNIRVRSRSANRAWKKD